jgi:hypothetical protein
MSRKRAAARPQYTRADVEAAAQNLVRKGLIVARTDVNGKVVYFPVGHEPPPEPFELESYRRKLRSS